MISEERLRQAAQEASRALADSLPEPEDCRNLVPPGFEPQWRTSRQRNRRKWQWNTFARAACFLAAVILGGTVFLSTNAQAKEIVFGWMDDFRDGVSHYFFEGANAKKTMAVSYSLGEIPEGYRLWKEDDAEILYENEDHLLLKFGYLERATINSASEIFFYVGDIPKSRAFVHGKPADCYLDESNEMGSLIIWMDQETDTLLYISGFFSEKELIKLAESVIREGN